MFFHAALTIYAEVQAGCHLEAGVFLMAGDGAGILAFLRKRRPTWALGLTDHHVKHLMNFLVAATFNGMQDEEQTVLYEPELAELIANAESEAGAADGNLFTPCNLVQQFSNMFHLV